MKLDALNAQFAITDAVQIVEGSGGLPSVLINNKLGRAQIYLHGAHVTHFQPVGHLPLLWLSETARFNPPGAIRGGVPLCWPWFGSPDTRPGQQSHGFARNQTWDLVETAAVNDGEHHIVMELADSPDSLALWPFRFRLTMTIVVSDRLTLSLRQTNTHDTDIEVAGALHSYFAVADIGNTQIEGLSGGEYLDYVDERRRKTQNGNITIAQEVDRIYTDTTSDVVIHDSGNDRSIRVEKKGSRTTVVWNPWVEKTKLLVDCTDDAYKEMLCVESVNTLSDSITLAPGDSHCLEQTISVY